MNNINNDLPIEVYIRNIFHYIQYSAEQDTEMYGITSRQGRLLEIIVDGLASGKKVNRKYLESTSFLKGSSVTSLLNGLEAKGFIERSTSKSDGRALEIKATAKGEQVIRHVKSLFVEQENKLLQGMTPNEIDIFRRLLKKSCENISAIEE